MTCDCRCYKHEGDLEIHPSKLSGPSQPQTLSQMEIILAQYYHSEERIVALQGHELDGAPMLVSPRGIRIAFLLISHAVRDKEDLYGL